MALIKCTACQADIAAKAVACPKCGQPNPKANHLPPSSVIGILALSAIGIWWFAAGGMQASTKKQMGSIFDQVADDAVKQYEIVKRQGDPVQICVNAGMVSAAYLQAQDERNYKSWKDIQSAACENAGVPM